MKLNEKIYLCRKRAALSQDALAERLGVSRQAISKWETGESVPDTGKLLPLANALGVSLDWLLSEDGPDEAGAGGGCDTGAPVQGTDGSGGTARTQAFRQGIKRWCWLAGVLLAACGAYLIYQAAMAKLAVSGLLSLVNIDGGLTDTTVLVNGVETPIGDLLANNPVSAISTVWLVIGIVLVLAGAVLAVFLKKKVSK